MQGRAGSAGYGPRAKQLELLKLDWDKKLAEFDQRIGPDLDRLKKQREQKGFYNLHHTRKNKRL
jgi:hypothetical protein